MKRAYSFCYDLPDLRRQLGKREEGRPLYEFAEPWTWFDWCSRIHTIPAGFETDLASIPKWLHWYIKPDDWDILLPCLCHDAVYGFKGKMPNGVKITRKESDEFLRKCCIEMGMRKTQAWMVYWSVRIGGGKAWRTP